MKSPFVKSVAFISKSLLWSALLYAACMLTINWNNLYGNLKHHIQPDVVEHTPLLPQAPVAIIPTGTSAPQINTPHTSMLASITAVADGLLGIMGFAGR